MSSSANLASSLDIDVPGSSDDEGGIASYPPERTGRQVRLYLVVGAWNTLFGYGMYAGLTYILTGLVPYPYMVASVLGWVVSVANAYVGYKLLVFRTTGNVILELVRFYWVYGIILVVNVLLLPIVIAGLSWGMENRPSVPYVAGAILTVGTVCYSYLMHRYYSFSVPQTGVSPESVAG